MRARFGLLLFLIVGLVAMPIVASAQDPAGNDTAADGGGSNPAPAPTTNAGGGAPQADAAGATQKGGQNAGDSQVVAESGKALIKLFVLAAILESALALLFNWRPVVVFFDRRGIKTLVSFAFACAITYGFGSKLLFELFRAYGLITVPAASAGDGLFLCQLLEAMVIAGGSSGVNNLFRTLGIRPVSRIDEVAPTPKPAEAWLAVALRRSKSVGPVDVEIAEGTDPKSAQWQIAGQISGTTAPTGIAKWFVRDFTRFPTIGGYTVATKTDYMLRVSGKGADGKPLPSSEVWGPHQLADRAIVDVDVTL